MLPQFFYSEFAYSRGMEIVLFFLVILTNFINSYIVTSILLAIFNEKIEKIKKIKFVLITVAYHTLTIYLPYMFSDFQGLGKLLNFVSTPNPTCALLYYCLCIKLFKIPKHRAVNMIPSMYLFSLLFLGLSRTLSFGLFSQPIGNYNYMLDAGSLVCSAFFYAIIYMILYRIINRSNFVINLTDSFFVGSIKNDMIYYFIFELLAYFTMIFAQFAYADEPYGMLMLSTIMAVSIVINLMNISRRADNANIQNKVSHINTLNSAISEFRAVKHDFYNVLGTYSGYIAINDLEGLKKYHEKLMKTTVNAGDQLDFFRKLEQNPSLCSLLMQKSEFAEKHNVHLHISLHCEIDHFDIDNLDFSRVLSCLIDNAIEAAIETDEKQVSFSIEEKKHGDKLIVISNSTNDDVNISKITLLGYTTKQGHSGIGLAQIRSIIAKYKNCGIHYVCYNKCFSAFLEIKNIDS